MEGCLGYWLLGGVEGFCYFLCLLGTRKRSFWCKEVIGRRAEFVVLWVNMWFLPRSAIHIRYIHACTGSYSVCVYQLWYGLPGGFLRCIVHMVECWATTEGSGYELMLLVLCGYWLVIDCCVDGP
jgi:hypothetical protein